MFDTRRQHCSLPLAGLVLLLATGPLGADLPDPTQPAARPPVQPAKNAEVNWVLSLIKTTAVERTAVLNGRLVREGDRIDSAQVVRIGPASVVMLNDNGQRREVKLTGRSVKRQGRLRTAVPQSRVQR